MSKSLHWICHKIETHSKTTGGRSCTDADFEFRKRCYECFGPYSSKDLQPFYVQNIHPISSDLMQFSLKLKFHQDGLAVANDFEAVGFTAKIYNNLRHRAPGSVVWCDLDWIAAVHGASSQMNDHELPSEAGTYLRPYVEAVRSQFPFSREGRLQPQSIVSQSLMDQCQNNPAEEFDHFRIFDLLSPISAVPSVNLEPEKLRSATGSYDKGNDADVPATYFSLHDSLLSSSATSRDRIETNVSDLIQVLCSLTSRLASESILMKFNYFSLHQRCTRFLCALLTEFESEMKEFSTGRKTKDTHASTMERKLTDVYTFILGQFMNDPKNELSLQEKDVVVRTENIMRRFAEEDGEVEITQLGNMLGEGPLVNFSTI